MFPSVFSTFQSALESFSEFETFEADQAAEDDAMDRDSDVDSDASDDADIFLDDGTVQQDEIQDMSDSESQASDIEFEGDADVGQEVKSPLFLQLTCSLKDTRSHGQPMTPVAINTLPVCLGRNKMLLCTTNFDENLRMKDYWKMRNTLQHHVIEILNEQLSYDNSLWRSWWEKGEGGGVG